MPVMVILEMDGDSDALLAAAAELEARRPTSAVTARVAAPMEGGIVVCTVWESASARDAYQSEPEHQEALQASGLMAAVTAFSSTPNCRCSSTSVTRLGPHPSRFMAYEAARD
jgi:hypothetical protein